MTKMFGNLNDDGLEHSGDRLGTGGVKESGPYQGIVKLAFAGKALASNAQSVTLHIDLNGYEYRETFWITNRSGENFYADKKDATKKHPLPGYTSIDDVCLLTTGQPLTEQPTEEKVVNLYNFEARKDVPTTVPVLVDLLNKPITIGVIKQIVDKQQKNDAGTYVNTGETREENIVDKFFHTESRRTVTEIREGLEEPVFYDKWVAKNQDKTRNRAKGGGEGKTGAPGRPAGPGSSPAPVKSLFGA